MILVSYGAVASDNEPHYAHKLTHGLNKWEKIININPKHHDGSVSSKYDGITFYTPSRWSHAKGKPFYSVNFRFNNRKFEKQSHTNLIHNYGKCNPFRVDLDIKMIRLSSVYGEKGNSFPITYKLIIKGNNGKKISTPVNIINHQYLLVAKRNSHWINVCKELKSGVKSIDFIPYGAYDQNKKRGLIILKRFAVTRVL